jgi:coenzyme PQQ precursor peptide PqqA
MVICIYLLRICGIIYTYTKKYTTNLWRIIMWTKPSASEMRFGFEVTMYVMNK